MMKKCVACVSGSGTTAGFYQYVRPFFGVSPNVLKLVRVFSKVLLDYLIVATLPVN